MFANKRNNPQQLVVQFHRLFPTGVLSQFIDTLKSNKVSTKLSELDYPYRINFYVVSSDSKTKSLVNKYSDRATTEPTLSILYQNESTVCEPPPKPTIKTILLRQSLQKIVNFQYELEHTQDEQQTLKFLIAISRQLVESQNTEELSLFDQLIENKVARSEATPQKVWATMLFQIQGIGIEKAEMIAEAYPTLESLYQGIQNKELENIPVRRGDKTGKLGKVLSGRIQRVFMTTNPKELV